MVMLRHSHIAAQPQSSLATSRTLSFRYPTSAVLKLHVPFSVHSHYSSLFPHRIHPIYSSMTTALPINGGATQDALDGLVKRDEAKGMAVHQFDPYASPTEKAAIAGKASSQVNSAADKGGSAKGELCRTMSG